MTLSCKHVDDVIIGAPFVITQDLLTSLKVKKVVVVTNTDEDPVKKVHRGTDQFEVPRKLGILEEVTIDDDFFKFTTENVAERVWANKEAY